MLAIVSLTGCQSRINRVMNLVRAKAKQVTEVAQVPTELGVITFYRYKALDRCGEGYKFQGAGGGGEHECKTVNVFTVSGGSSGSSKPNGNMSLWYGLVTDPTVEKVIVTVDDNQKLTAQLLNGMWYVLFPGQADLPNFKSIEGYDSSGQRIVNPPVVTKEKNRLPPQD